MVDPEILIDRIYEAAAIPDGWPAVLDELSKCVGGVGAGLLTRRSDAWLGWRHAAYLAQEADAYMRSAAAKRSITTDRLLAENRAGFVPDHELFTPEEYAADPLSTHFLAPNNLHHGAATAILTPGGDIAVVQVQKTAGADRFTPQELQRLDAFRPHLARAALLATRWRFERLRAAAEALALIGLPAVVVGWDGRVLAANELTDSLAGHVIWRADNRVALADPVANAVLQQSIASLRAETSAEARSFLVPGRNGAEPIIAHLVPMRGKSRELFDGGASVLVATPVGSRPGIEARIVQGLFDLTAAEARVAARLLDGLTARTIAALHGVSVETVRTQAKAVFAKTGVRGQVDFIARFQFATRI